MHMKLLPIFGAAVLAIAAPVLSDTPNAALERQEKRVEELSGLKASNPQYLRDYENAVMVRDTLRKWINVGYGAEDDRLVCLEGVISGYVAYDPNGQRWNGPWYELAGDDRTVGFFGNDPGLVPGTHIYAFGSMWSQNPSIFTVDEAFYLVLTPEEYAFLRRANTPEEIVLHKIDDILLRKANSLGVPPARERSYVNPGPIGFVTHGNRGVNVAYIIAGAAVLLVIVLVLVLLLSRRSSRRNGAGRPRRVSPAAMPSSEYANPEPAYAPPPMSAPVYAQPAPAPVQPAPVQPAPVYAPPPSPPAASAAPAAPAYAPLRPAPAYAPPPSPSAAPLSPPPPSASARVAVEYCPFHHEPLVNGECVHGCTIPRCSECGAILVQGVCPNGCREPEYCPSCGSRLLSNGSCPRGCTIVRCSNCGKVLRDGICPNGCNAEPLHLGWPGATRPPMSNFALEVVSPGAFTGFRALLPNHVVIGRSAKDAREPFLELLVLDPAKKSACSRRYVELSIAGAGQGFTVKLLKNHNFAVVRGRKLVVEGQTEILAPDGILKLNPDFELKLVRM